LVLAYPEAAVPYLALHMVVITAVSQARRVGKTAVCSRLFGFGFNVQTIGNQSVQIRRLKTYASCRFTILLDVGVFMVMVGEANG
jgi:hypothetical protein